MSEESDLRKARAEAHRAEEDAPTSGVALDVLVEIRRVAREELELDLDVAMGHGFLRDLHLDSLALATLAASVEARFGVALDEHDAAHIDTVADLVRLVVRRIEEADR